MPDQPKSFTARITRKQGILLGVLGVVLVYVMMQGMGESPETSTEPEAPAARRKTAAVSTRATSTVELKRVSLPIEQIVQQNPFAKLVAPPKPEPKKPEPPPVAIVSVAVPKPPDPVIEKRAKERQERIQQIIAELHGHKVRMILRTDKKTSAMIGNRLVSEGDVIEGVRIISILPTGVIVKPVAEKP